jgi:Zn-dependent protease with chaperone function
MTIDSPSSDGSPAPSPSIPKIAAIAGLALAVPVVIVACVILAVIPGVSWWVGIPVGLVIAGAIVLLRLRRAADLVLAQLGATPASTDAYPRLHNLTEGLSLAGGVSEPELYVIDDPGRNAAAVAQGSRSAVVCSTGLLDALDRISLEGVLAEVLVRIRSGDAEAATLGAALYGDLLRGPLAAIGRPAAVFGLRRLLADDRDLSADRAAVALTRYPPGLLSALTVIREGSPTTATADASNEHLWLVPPATVNAVSDTTVEGSPLDLRIDVLGEL